jgi:hypothetical protein
MAIDSVSAAQLALCGAYEPEAGYCQLTSGHRGTHATHADEAFLTWDLRQISRWSKDQPAWWLFDLPWAPGRQPQVARSLIKNPAS